MNIIFLDIDGVLNSAIGDGETIFDMEIAKLNLLKSIVDTCKTGVVITSDWRYSIRQKRQLVEVFTTYRIPILGMLRDPGIDDEDNRGKQILDYINTYSKDIDNIVILDDNDDGISEIFHEDFIKTNKFYGLDKSIANRIVDILM